VVFLPGCNFRCPFCHNHILVLDPGSLPDIPLGDVLRRAALHPGWIDGLVVTGGEPTILPDIKPFLEAVRERSLAVKLDTNGSRPDVLSDLIGAGLVDAVAMDVKAPLETELYSLLAGVPVDVEAIRRSIAIIVKSGLSHTFRTTVVPDFLDEAAIERLAASLKGSSGLTLQAFHPNDALDPAWRSLRRPDDALLVRLSERANGILQR
jgi:pyruvate formate lyase activating enzyme